MIKLSPRQHDLNNGMGRGVVTFRYHLSQDRWEDPEDLKEGPDALTAVDHSMI